MIVSPTLSLNNGPGIDPLNVSACAITPLPTSTVASLAMMVVSTMVGSGLVSTISGATYGSPPEVACAGPLKYAPSKIRATTESAPSAMAKERRRCQRYVDIVLSWIFWGRAVKRLHCDKCVSGLHRAEIVGIVGVATIGGAHWRVNSRDVKSRTCPDSYSS